MIFSAFTIYGILTVIATTVMITPGQVDQFVQLARSRGPEFQQIPVWFIVTALALAFTLSWPILMMAALFGSSK